MSDLIKASQWDEEFKKRCWHGTGKMAHECVSCRCEIVQMVQTQVFRMLDTRMPAGNKGMLRALSLEVNRRF